MRTSRPAKEVDAGQRQQDEQEQQAADALIDEHFEKQVVDVPRHEVVATGKEPMREPIGKVAILQQVPRR